MDIPYRELATANAAKLVVPNLLAKLHCSTTPQKEINEAVIPLFGIRWGLAVFRRVGARKLRHVLWCLRNSKLSETDYNRVGQLWKTAVADTGSFPDAWGSWRTLIGRFNLDDEVPLHDWVVTIDTCIKLGWSEPAKLSLVDPHTVQTETLSHRLPLPAIHLWEASALVFSENSGGSIPALKGASADAESLPIRLKAVSLADSAVRKDVAKSIKKTALPKNFFRFGPNGQTSQITRSFVQ